MAAVFVFTGENRYALQEAKTRWIQEFVKKHGSDNLLRLEGKPLTLRSLLDEVAVMPFLSERRLFIIDGIPKLSKEDVDVLLEQVHPQVIVVFADPKPDKRLTGVKQLLAKVEVKEYPPLKGPKLSQWIAEQSKTMNAGLDLKAQALLLEMVGEDQEALLHEIEKMALFSGGSALSSDDVDRMVIPTDEGVIWKVTDLISAGKKKEAATFVRKMLERGGDAYGLWAILLSFLKNTVAVRIALDGGLSSPQEIAEETGVHPFALRSLLPFAKKIKMTELRRFLQWATKSDVQLKTGQLRSTDEAPEELRALLDRFLLTCP